MERRIALGLVAAALLCGCGQPAKDQPLTKEGKAYVRNLQLTDVGMKATESYAKQTLTEIEGNVKNAGDRTVDRVDVFCLFYDRSGVMVLRERVPMVKRTLKPGETRRFRLAFDDIPDSWNNQMPQLVIAQVVLG